MKRIPGRSCLLALSCVLLLLVPGAARAHKLVVDCRALPGRKVQVEAWYNSASKPHPARRAAVQVFQPPDGPLLVEGRLDDHGFFSFTHDRPEAVKVVVYQTGHREELVLTAAALAGGQNADADPADSSESPPTTSAPGARNSHEWIKEVLIGVGFLLALAAFLLSLRNARDLRTLRSPPP